MKRYVALILVVVLVLTCTMFIGCEKNDKQKITISEVTHSVFYAPQYVAINLGFFEKKGIEVELVNGGGADKVMTAVLANQVDIGFAGPEAAIYVYLEGKEDYPEVFAQVTKKDGSFWLQEKKMMTSSGLI